MPVQQLENQQGGLGTILGLVGGYLATNPQRKAEQADREARQKQTDVENKRADAQAKEYADNIHSEIAARDAGAKNTETDRNAALLQKGAFAKYAPMLQVAPKDPKTGKKLTGPALQNWVQGIRQKALGDGVTDADGQARLTKLGQDLVQQDQAASAQSFVQHENQLPKDPKQMIPFLLKRLQAERGVPGVDTKPTQQMLTDQQKNVEEGRRAAHDSAMENIANRRINTSITLQDMRDNSRGGRSGGITPFQQVEIDRWNREDATKAKDKANKPAPQNKEFSSESGDLRGNTDFKTLPPVVQSTITGLVEKHGIQDTMSALNKIAQGAKSPKMTQEQAQSALDALNGQ